MDNLYDYLFRDSCCSKDSPQFDYMRHFMQPGFLEAGHNEVSGSIPEEFMQIPSAPQAQIPQIPNPGTVSQESVGKAVDTVKGVFGGS